MKQIFLAVILALFLSSSVMAAETGKNLNPLNDETPQDNSNPLQENDQGNTTGDQRSQMVSELLRRMFNANALGQMAPNSQPTQMMPDANENQATRDFLDKLRNDETARREFVELMRNNTNVRELMLSNLRKVGGSGQQLADRLQNDAEYRENFLNRFESDEQYRNTVLSGIQSWYSGRM